MKKIISVIIVISMCLSIASTTVSAESIRLDGGELLKQNILSKKILDEELKLTNPSAQDKAIINIDYLQKCIEKNEKAYREYGGCYIDDEQNVHVLFTENVDKEVINNINETISSNIVYETSKYALNELVELQETITNYISKETTNPELEKLIEDIVGIGINQEDNIVFVGIKDCDENKIKLFKKEILDSTAIVFENVTEIEYVAGLNAGQGISIGTSLSTAGEYSIGYRCYMLLSTGYIAGFVTAAHGNTVGNKVYVSGEIIGSVIARSRINNGTVDAAFVQITDNEYVLANKTAYRETPLVAGSYIGSFSAGETVKKEGSKTEFTSGKIISANYTFNDTVVIRDCISATYNCGPGDSGGIVYQTVNSSNYVAGICMGKVTQTNTSTGEQTSFGVFVKAENIEDALNVIVY